MFGPGYVIDLSGAALGAIAVVLVLVVLGFAAFVWRR